jgi:PHP family Zn ribbon phosphoesterase
MFCSKCRRRVLFKKSKQAFDNIFNQYSITENFIIILNNNPEETKKEYINQINRNKMICPACKKELGKNYKLKLGVSERIDVISTYKEPKHPNHRPKYINAIPLIDIIRAVKKIKSKTSTTVLNAYDKMIQELGREFEILIDTPIEKIKNFDHNIAEIIEAFRNNKIQYTPGGGGVYGQIRLDI